MARRDSLWREGSLGVETRRTSMWREGAVLENVAADVPEDAAHLGKSVSWHATVEAGDVFQTDLDAIVPPAYKSDEAEEAELQMVRARRDSVRVLLHQAPDVSRGTTRLQLGDKNRIALEEFVGTALVLAFLQVTQLLDVLTLATWRHAAEVYFSGVATPAGRSFDETATAFLTLLSPHVLDGKNKWFVKARLWKVILSQAPDGYVSSSHAPSSHVELIPTCSPRHCRYWDATRSIAFALEARPAAETAQIKPTWLERMKSRLAGAGDVALALGVDNGDSGPGGTDDLGEIGDDQDVQDDDFEDGQPDWLQEGEFEDDPLQCRARTVLAAMPRRMRAMRLELAAAAAAYGAPAGVGSLDLNRVWTTQCVIALLESINVCWLATNGEEFPETELTIVDAAYGWIELQVKEHPELKTVLADGAAAAQRIVPLWHSAWLRRIAAVRRSEAVLAHVGKSHAHRAGGELLRALVTRHDTFRVFLCVDIVLFAASARSRALALPSAGLSRWTVCSAGRCGASCSRLCSLSCSLTFGCACTFLQGHSTQAF